MTQDPEKFIRVDGLREIIVHPGVETSAAVFFERDGRHRDNRNIRMDVALADSLCRFDSVRLRHLYIHENEIIVALADHLNGFRPVLGAVDRDVFRREKADRNLSVNRVIFGEKNARPGKSEGIRRRGLREFERRRRKIRHGRKKRLAKL